MTMIQFRSNFEKQLANSLNELGIEYEYEQYTIPYFLPITNAKCGDCGSKEVYVPRTYLPDFWIPSLGFFIEAKGKFTEEHRKKHLAVKKENPFVDLRFVFQYDNWMTRKHANRYSDWCKKNNFRYAVDNIPEEWLRG